MRVAALQPERARIALLGGLVHHGRDGRGVSDSDRERLADAQQAVLRQRASDPWQRVARAAGLGALDEDILACTLAPESDAGIGALYQSLQPAGGPHATPGLIRELLFLGDHDYPALFERLAPDAPLRRTSLLRCAAVGTYEPLHPGAMARAELLGVGRGDEAPPGTVRLPVQAAWNELVLPAHALRRLEEYLLWIRHRETVFGDWGGRAMGGPVALFSGPPGTGKTFAAEAMAARLGWPLFRVDLGRLVSKYVGETEQNLNRLFDAVCGRRAILLFDEADSLFGRRGEVTDARDRYANMEVSHLLSRIERHQGPCILTTNLRQQVDPAFSRRFQSVIEFPRPDRDARVGLWRGALPPRAPLADGVDCEVLAEAVALTGGQIRNAATHAAFLAAGAGGPLGMAELARAVWQELAKDGRETPPEAIGGLAAWLKEGER